MDNYKDFLKRINDEQRSTFCPLEVFRKAPYPLATHRQGLYWIWTNLSDDDLIAIRDDEETARVPISKLVQERRNLENICKEKKEGFRIIYNGIGSGLRERINQELNCSSMATGSLALQTRGVKDENLRISFFDFGDNKHILGDYNYLDDAESIEINWRVEFGIPILSRY